MKKNLIFSLFIFNYCFGNSNFVIKKIQTDKIFYNVVLHENKVYVSSNDGVYIIDSFTNKLIMYDESIKGTINSNLSKNLNGFKVNFIKSPIPIPEPYLKTVTDFAYKENYLYIIAKGDLIIYETEPYKFYPYESVRSISKNSIGTYGGVYINGQKLKKINYSNGQLREFDSVTFVCYNGLLEFKDGQEKILYNNDNSKFSDNKYGIISDIFSIGNSNYLTISSNGIYTYNYKLNRFNLIYSNENKIIPIKNKIENRILNNSEFHFIDDDKYLSIHTKNLKKRVVYDNFEHKLIDILECSIDGNIFYGITENKSLLKFKRQVEGLELINSYQLSFEAHTISDVGDLIFLTGNDGLSVFVKSTEEIFERVITDEFNKYATYKSKKGISFGSIHGVYKIENITEFQKSSSLRNVVQNNYYSYKNEILILFFSLTLLIIIYKSMKKKNLSNEELVIEIKKFIGRNLATVTLNSLQEKFDLDYNAINNLQKGFRPAKFIKQERNKKAKYMFTKNYPISKISLYSGYSESYLLKNKYNFLKIK